MGDVKRPVQTNQRNIREIFGRVTNDGTPAIAEGEGFTLTDVGTGVVTVTLDKPGRSIQGLSCIVIEDTAATGHFVKASAVSASAVTFNTFVADATDGAPADVDFAFSITVKDSEV